MTWVSLLKHKGEVFQAFKELYNTIKTVYRREIQVLQSDNGGEYINYTMKNFCKQNLIRHQMPCARSPQQNGLAERKNRQLLEVVRASLFDMEVPRKFWGEALRSAAYLLNRTPSKVLGFQTPLQKLRELTDISQTDGLEPRIFGCTAYVYQNVGKLEPRSVKCMFLGYADTKEGYRCLDTVQNKVHVTRDVSFHETVPYFGHGCSLQGEKNAEVETHDFYEEISSFQLENEEHDTECVNSSQDTPSTDVQPESSMNEEPESSQNAEQHIPDTNTPDVVLDTGSLSDFMHDDEELEDTVHGTNVEEIIERRYPERTNRGQPKKQYVPDIKARSKYPIGNFVSHHRLSESHALRV